MPLPFILTDKTKKMMLHILARLLIASLLVIIVLILIQDFQVYPGAVSALFTSKKRLPNTLPLGVESFFIDTSDGKKLEVWRLPALDPPKDESLKGKTAIIFHGNGDSLSNFFDMQLWLKDLGITSYGFDYRGFGKSSGWPSEKGLYKDAEAVWDFALKKENTTKDNAIVIGLSLGGAPAAYIAEKEEIPVLILFSAFTSIVDRAKEMLLFRYFTPFIWSKLPTKKYVSKLKNTCLIVSHGKKDRVVPFHHGEEIRDAYKGSKRVFWVPSEYTMHNDNFSVAKDEVGKKLIECLREEES